MSSNGGTRVLASSPLTFTRSTVPACGIRRGGIHCDGGGGLNFSEGGLFNGNVAWSNGGAISMMELDEVIMVGFTFTSNTAELGGAIYSSSVQDTTRVYDNCIFEDNQADHGGAIYFHGGADRAVVQASGFRRNHARTSGGGIYLAGTLGLYNTMFVQNKAGEVGMAVVSITVSSAVEMTDVLFKNNMFYCSPGQYSHDVIDMAASRFDTVCRGCSNETSGIPSSVTILDETAIPFSCLDLPVGTNSSSSGTTVASFTLLPGYYRTSNKSRLILECYMPDACVGGSNNENYCADGYEGAYCAVCSKGYSSGIAYRCTECSRVARRSAVVVGVSVVVGGLIVAAVLLRRIWRVTDEETGDDLDAPQGFVQRKCAVVLIFVLKMFPLTSIKIVVVVWQIVTQFSAIAGEVYPQEYELFLSHLSFINFDIGGILSYSCILSPDFYDRLLLTTIAPLVILAILATMYFVVKQRYNNSHDSVRAARNKHLSAALFVVFFVYSSVSNTIFQTFVCDLLDDGVSYLQADYSLTCSTKRHSVYTAYASLMVVVYPVGVPALFSWWLSRNRQYLQMSNRHTMARLQPFAGIWGTYKPSRYYFEVVECCRRIVLTASAVFLVPNSVGQISVILSLAVAFLFISESLSPFEKNADMGLYRWGNGIILASMYVALLMKVDTSQETAGMLSVFGGVLIAANVAMIIVVVVQSVLLAKEWHGFSTPVEQILPIIRHPTSVCPQTMTSGPSVRMQHDRFAVETRKRSLRQSVEVHPDSEISPAVLAPLSKPRGWTNSQNTEKR